MPDETCGHCGRPITSASRGIAADGTVLCHTGTIPADDEPQDCYRLVMIRHATDGTCCYTAEAKLANFYDNIDTSTLDSEEVDVEPAVNPRVSQSVSFDLEDMRELRRVASERGTTVPDLIHAWALDRLKSTRTQVNMPGAVTVTIYECGRLRERYETGG